MYLVTDACLLMRTHNAASDFGDRVSCAWPILIILSRALSQVIY